MNRKLGGAEQAFLDYYSALTLKGHEVVNITSLFAKINNKKISSLKLPNLFPWCILSKIYLKLLILFYRPDLIIVHGGRAVNFAYGTGIKIIPIIGVTHSYSIRHILKCNYIIALDQLLKHHLISSGYPESQIFIVPNMINTPAKKINNFSQKRTEYVIGALGRFVPEKGFNYLIEAISILRDRKYRVKLLIGGAGPLEIQLKKLAHGLNIGKNIEFIGWINDKESFFKTVDIFCIPSVFETFGIVALEAMSHQVPIVATKTAGASQIFEAGSDALITNTASNQGLADNIAYLIDNPLRAQELIDKAYGKIISYYDTRVVADRLLETLKVITQKN
ncbi:MAG: glycosyltransferase family 4 protein [Rickettsiaceae bacterium]|nr:glycosyltransferase family 4 protein [Rickettsiaceae bacterium]MCP5378090.1 glycosyltransferase family 4 protein [Rickettsiaceae bacterium]